MSHRHPPRGVPRRLLSSMVLLAVLAGGCRLDVAAQAELALDGSGRVGIEARFDAALLDELAALGVDPTAELESVVAGLRAADGVQGGAAGAWEVTRAGDGADGVVVTVTRPVAEPAEIGATLRALASGLVEDDPALLVDIEVAVDGDGAAQVTGTGSFRPPASAGARLDGVPIGPEGEDLAARLLPAVAPAFVLTLPTVAVDHDADHVDGRTLRWELGVQPRPITARSEAPGALARLGGWPLVAAGAAVLAGIGALLVVRRRR